VGVLVGVKLGVKLGVNVGVRVGVRVGSRVGGGLVGMRLKKVGMDGMVGVTISVPVTGSNTVIVAGGTAGEVAEETEMISENAWAVSTIIVFMLETTYSTKPTGSVPTGAARLMSLTPTAAAPHIRLMPMTAARTTHSNGR